MDSVAIVASQRCFQQVFPCSRARNHQCVSATWNGEYYTVSALLPWEVPSGARTSLAALCSEKTGSTAAGWEEPRNKRHRSTSHRQRQTEAKVYHVREISPGLETPPFFWGRNVVHPFDQRAGLQALLESTCSEFGEPGGRQQTADGGGGPTS